MSGLTRSLSVHAGDTSASIAPLFIAGETWISVPCQTKRPGLLRPGEHLPLCSYCMLVKVGDCRGTLPFYLVSWGDLVHDAIWRGLGSKKSPGRGTDEFDLHLGLALAVLHGTNHIIARWPLVSDSSPVVHLSGASEGKYGPLVRCTMSIALCWPSQP